MADKRLLGELLLLLGIADAQRIGEYFGAESGQLARARGKDVKVLLHVMLAYAATLEQWAEDRKLWVDERSFGALCKATGQDDKTPRLLGKLMVDASLIARDEPSGKTPRWIYPLSTLFAWLKGFQDTPTSMDDPTRKPPYPQTTLPANHPTRTSEAPSPCTQTTLPVYTDPSKYDSIRSLTLSSVDLDLKTNSTYGRDQEGSNPPSGHLPLEAVNPAPSTPVLAALPEPVAPAVTVQAPAQTPAAVSKPRNKRVKEPLVELKELPADVRARVEPALERLLHAQRIGVRVETGERLDLDNPVYWLRQMAQTYPAIDLASEIGKADSWLVAVREVRAAARGWLCKVWFPRAKPANGVQGAVVTTAGGNAQPTLDELIAAARAARRENRPTEFGRVYSRIWGKSPLPMVYATTVQHEQGVTDCPCWGCLNRLRWWSGPKPWTDLPVCADDPRAMQGSHAPTAEQHRGPDDLWVDE